MIMWWKIVIAIVAVVVIAFVSKFSYIEVPARGC